MTGKAERLRNHHGMARDDATFFARAIHNPYSRCAICGIPGRILQAYWRLGRRGLGKGPLLQVDHLDPWAPGERKNIRLLCGRCNAARGAAVRMDEEVLRKVRRWYEACFMRGELWFLNTTPGRGGLSRLGKKHEADILARTARAHDPGNGSNDVRPTEGGGDRERGV